MRVLVAHNFYRSSAPSGENQLVRAEVALLREGGVEAVEMFEESDTIPGGVRGVVRAAPGPIYSPSGVRRFKRLLDTVQPDVVHLHQVTPLISPAVVSVANTYGVPVVQTVHNYRHGCANGLHLRDGHVCTDCVGSRLGLPAVRHGCYRDSRLQTVPVTIGMVSHRRTWREGVARYLALTPFMRDMLVSYGLPPERITVRPTWVVDPGTAGEPGRDVLYVGRLDEAKGIDRLLDAWALARRSGLHPQQRLVIAGDGPLRESRVRRAGRRLDDHLARPGLAGPRGAGDGRRGVRRGALPVFEGYPLVVAEAFGRGRAVLTVSGGSVGIDRRRRDGLGRGPDVRSVGAGTDLDHRRSDARSRGAGARTSYEQNNAPTSGLASLLRVYDAVVAGNRSES